LPISERSAALVRCYEFSSVGRDHGDRPRWARRGALKLCACPGNADILSALLNRLRAVSFSEGRADRMSAFPGHALTRIFWYCYKRNICLTVCALRGIMRGPAGASRAGPFR
jgi:hypothetical protein